jgi:hypothetical protein
LAHLRSLFSRARRESGTVAAVAEAVLADLAVDIDVAGPVAAPVAPGEYWTTARLALAQQLWGEGFLSPGGSAEVLRLAAPIGLNESMSLLFVGAGIGGPPQALSNEHGVWVASQESDPTLLPLARERLLHSRALVAKRTTADAWHPNAPRFRKRGFHHAMAFDALREGTPHAVLAALAHAIKPGGQLVMQELVADGPLDPADPVVAAWCRLERRSAELPNEAFISETLQRLGLEVRVSEDQSTRHVGMAVQGWKVLLQALNGARPERGSAEALVDEVEMWARRIALMHAGRIRLVRWHAMA